jgi:hypothetical protein
MKKSTVLYLFINSLFFCMIPLMAMNPTIPPIAFFNFKRTPITNIKGLGLSKDSEGKFHKGELNENNSISLLTIVGKTITPNGSKITKDEDELTKAVIGNWNECKEDPIRYVVAKFSDFEPTKKVSKEINEKKKIGEIFVSKEKPISEEDLKNLLYWTTTPVTHWKIERSKSVIVLDSSNLNKGSSTLSCYNLNGN